MDRRRYSYEGYRCYTGETMSISTLRYVSILQLRTWQRQVI